MQALPSWTKDEDGDQDDVDGASRRRQVTSPGLITQIASICRPPLIRAAYSKENTMLVICLFVLSIMYHV